MLKLRRADICVVCQADLPPGICAWWDPQTRKVTCMACRHATEPETAQVVLGALDRGAAGGSVGREYARRRRKREMRTLEAHPRIGRLLLKLSEAPSHEQAFRKGELGEIEVAASLERGVTESAIVLHDRRMPSRQGNIDHLIIAPSGVFVVDAKGCKGKVRVQAPLLSPAKLLIGGHDRTRFIDGLDRQVAAVRDALSTSAHPDEVIHGVLCFTNAHPDEVIHGVLCFTNANLPIFGTLQMRGHLLLHREPLVKRLNAKGSLRPRTIEMLAHLLAGAFPSA